MVNYQRIKRLKEQHDAERKRLEAELRRITLLHQKVAQVLEGTLHEVRRFSSEISAYAEQLHRLIAPASGAPSQSTHLADTIFFTSGMLSARLAFADLELNPANVGTQIRTNAGVYKKFEKARHILGLKARSKNIAVRFQGQSFFSLDLLQAFELVPFVLLENAVKYSPANEEIVVSFDESLSRKLIVEITSMGPQAKPDEIAALTRRGFRSECAVDSGISGDGLGLFLVDFLCGLHDVGIRIGSDHVAKYSLGGIPYSQFRVELTFER